MFGFQQIEFTFFIDYIIIDKEIRAASTEADRKLSEFEVEVRYFRLLLLH